jgi:hypothetical protein
VILCSDPDSEAGRIESIVETCLFDNGSPWKPRLVGSTEKTAFVSCAVFRGASRELSTVGLKWGPGVVEVIAVGVKSSSFHTGLHTEEGLLNQVQPRKR